MDTKVLVSHAELVITMKVMMHGAKEPIPMEMARYSDTYYINDTDMSNYNYGSTQQVETIGKAFPLEMKHGKKDLSKKGGFPNDEVPAQEHGAGYPAE